MEKEMIVILYVADQKRSKLFYETILKKAPELDEPGMTCFRIHDQFSIGLMPEAGIEKILGDSVPAASSGNGIPRCELYLFVNDPEFSLETASQAGAKIISLAKGQRLGRSCCILF